METYLAALEPLNHAPVFKAACRIEPRPLAEFWDVGQTEVKAA
jgi:hypothetical protein